MPAVHEYYLSNGMTILCYPQNHLHSMELGLYLKGGTLYENRQNQGVSHLLEHLCFHGHGNGRRNVSGGRGVPHADPSPVL